MASGEDGAIRRRISSAKPPRNTASTKHVVCAIPLRTQGICDRATRASSPAPTPTRPPLAAFTEPDRPKDLLIRFITVSDSHVDVTGPGQHSDKNRWNCHGCGDSSDRPEQDYLFRIRPNANSHAAACRAIPLR